MRPIFAEAITFPWAILAFASFKELPPVAGSIFRFAVAQAHRSLTAHQRDSWSTLDLRCRSQLLGIHVGYPSSWILPSLTEMYRFRCPTVAGHQAEEPRTLFPHGASSGSSSKNTIATNARISSWAAHHLSSELVIGHPQYKRQPVSPACRRHRSEE